MTSEEDKDKGNIYKLNVSRIPNLSLPAARIDPQHSDPSSTNVSWLLPLSKFVVFEVWKGFGGLITKTGVAMFWVPRDRWSEVNRAFETIRDVLEPPRLDTVVDHDERPVFSHATSMNSIHGNMFVAVDKIIQNVHRNRIFSMVMKSVLLGDPKRVPRGAEENPKSLEEELQPIWHDLVSFGGKNDATPRRKKKKARRAKQKVPERMPDCVLVLRHGVNFKVESPIAAFEIKGPKLDILSTPRIILQDSKSGLPHKNVSAEELVSRYNFVFQKHRRNEESKEHRKAREEIVEGCTVDEEEPSTSTEETQEHKRPAELPSMASLKPVAQAISYAMSVKSGCVFLENFHCGVAMRVVRGGEGEIRVQVARPLFREGSKKGRGLIEEMSAMSMYAIKRTFEDTSLPTYLKECAEMVEKELGRKKDKAVNDSTEDGGEKGPDGGGNGSGEGEDGPGEGGDGPSTGLKRKPPDSHKKSRKRKKANKSTTASGDCSVGAEREGAARLAKLRDGFDLDVETSECTFEPAEMTVRDARQLVAQKPRLIGQGRSGKVYEVLWKGSRVALKTWNGVDWEGLEDFKNEVGVIEELLRHSSFLFGSILPRVFLISRTECVAGGPVMATELVGNALVRGQVDGIILSVLLLFVI